MAIRQLTLVIIFLLACAADASWAQQAPAPAPTQRMIIRPPVASPPGSDKAVAVQTEEMQIEALKKDVDGLKRNVDGLNRRIGSLESQLANMAQRTNFSCKSQTVSVNGAGVEQNCAPYRCQPIDGRCGLATCRSVNDCADGWVCSARLGSLTCVQP